MTTRIKKQNPNAAVDEDFEALVREYAEAREAERQKALSQYVHSLFTSAPQQSVSKQSSNSGA